MLYLFNNLNKYQNNKEYRKLQEGAKISSDEVYSFYFEDDYSRFLNMALSKSFFTTKTRFIVLKILDSDLSNPEFSNFLILLNDFVSSVNHLVIESDANVFKKLEKLIDNSFAFKPYQYKELKLVVDELLKKYKIKTSFNFKRNLFKIKDPFMIEAELLRITLLEQNNNPSDLLLFQPHHSSYNLFYKHFLLKSSQTLSQIKEFASNDDFYLLIEYFIIYVTDLIIYQMQQFDLSNEDKKQFLINTYNEEKSAIVNQVDISTLNYLLRELINIKREILFSKTNKKNELIMQKLSLLFLQ